MSASWWKVAGALVAVAVAALVLFSIFSQGRAQAQTPEMRASVGKVNCRGFVLRDRMTGRFVTVWRAIAHPFSTDFEWRSAQEACRRLGRR